MSEEGWCAIFAVSCTCRLHPNARRYLTYRQGRFYMTRGRLTAFFQKERTLPYLSLGSIFVAVAVGCDCLTMSAVSFIWNSTSLIRTDHSCSSAATRAVRARSLAPAPPRCSSTCALLPVCLCSCDPHARFPLGTLFRRHGVVFAPAPSPSSQRTDRAPTQERRGDLGADSFVGRLAAGRVRGYLKLQSERLPAGRPTTPSCDSSPSPPSPAKHRAPTSERRWRRRSAGSRGERARPTRTEAAPLSDRDLLIRPWRGSDSRTGDVARELVLQRESERWAKNRCTRTERDVESRVQHDDSERR